MALPDPHLPMSRRRMLAVGGSLLGGAVALVACGRSSSGDGAASTATAGSGSAASPTGSSGTTATTGAAGTISTAGADASGLASGTPATTVFTAADFVGLGTCQLLPELTQGPFPTTVQIERRDITEGLPGMPLRVGIRVVDESCVPIPGATVEVWHCDVDGDYSEYEDGYTADDGGADTTFLRGSQVANAEGIVEFVTNWPGWYSGRAVHIHSKVHIDDSTVLTTQFLFDDALNEEVLATGVYASHGQPDTTNASDGVTGGNGAADGLVFTVSDDSDLAGKRALIVVGLDPAATSSQTGGGTGGGPGGGGPGGPGGGAPG